MDFTPRHVAIAYLWEIIEIRAGRPVPEVDWHDPALRVSDWMEREEFLSEAFNLAVAAMELAVEAGAAVSERALLPALAARLLCDDDVRSLGDGG